MSRIESSAKWSTLLMIAAFFPAAFAEPPILPVQVVIPNLINHFPLPPKIPPKREMIIHFIVGKTHRIEKIIKISGNKEALSLVKSDLLKWKFSGQGTSKIRFIIKTYASNERGRTEEPSSVFNYPDTMILYHNLPINYD